MPAAGKVSIGLASAYAPLCRDSSSILTLGGAVRGAEVSKWGTSHRKMFDGKMYIYVFFDIKSTYNH